MAAERAEESDPADEAAVAASGIFRGLSAPDLRRLDRFRRSHPDTLLARFLRRAPRTDPSPEPEGGPRS